MDALLDPEKAGIDDTAQDEAALVKHFVHTKVHTFPTNEKVPLKGVVRGLWCKAVTEKSDGACWDRDRVTYECVLHLQHKPEEEHLCQAEQQERRLDHIDTARHAP
ncbi:hypothetical protein AF72_07765 [Xylella taiwanensis]|uniref:Uncharacterized protein n=1 Tax=Xylella taiwanensis TaxID=1444770 RepID=Z9JI59_9GAMM|nr:hypothetical protein AF72_07765 [Xylella taiwanensis]